MDNQKNIWALQLLRYFIISKGYTQVRFVDTATRQEDTDIWLANQASNHYVVVHITDKMGVADLISNSQGITLQARSIINILKKSGKCLNICLDVSENHLEGDEMDFISVYPGCSLSAELLKEFPGLNTVCFNVDKPEEESKAITNAVNNFAMQHNDVKQRRKKAFFSNFSTTFNIIAPICILIWAVINIASLITKYDIASWSVVFGAYYKAFIVILHEWWRLLTGGFVHISIIHLFCNMTSLLSLSKVVEEKIGAVKTIIILLFSIIAGNLTVFMGNGNILTVGISGGLYGLLGTMAIIFWKEGYFKYPNFVRSMLTTVYINLLINFMPNVSVLAHLGGLVGGAFLGFILTSNEKAVKVNFAICLLLITMAEGYFASRNYSLDEYYYLTDREVASIFMDLGLTSVGSRIENETYTYYYGGK